MTLPKKHSLGDVELEFVKRKSPRLPKYDYASDNYYFVTICTHNKKCMFGNSQELNGFGKIVEDHIKKLNSHFLSVNIDKYVVMPNHIHLIVVLGCDPQKENTISLETVIGLLKSGITRQIHKNHPKIRIWQRSFHDHIIRNQQSYEKIWLYIESNPQNWEKDCFYED